MKEKENFEEQINSLDEKALLGLLKKYNLTYPIELSTIDLILDQIEPVELTEETEELFLSTMRNTMELKLEAEEKLSNPDQATSFGELLFLFREKERFTVDELAEKLNIEPTIIRSIEDDNIPFFEEYIRFFVALTKYLSISYNAAIILILNSFRISIMKQRTRFRRSYARAAKNISEALRIRKNKEADHKTLLRLSKKKETEEDRNEMNRIKEMLSSKFNEVGDN